MKLVDAEDIANDNISTHDLTLEVNSIANQIHSQTLDTQQSEQLKSTQPRDPNNKHKPAYKKHRSYSHRTNLSISDFIKKQRDVMKTKETRMLYLNLHKNILYNLFALISSK